MKDYIGLADTAKLVRGALAKAFPGVKFYVRSKSYAGGASITVYYDGLDHWDEGPDTGHPFNRNMTAVYKPGMPAKAAVDAVVHGYGSQSFDGMIDMAFGVDGFLTPDGDVVATASIGSAGSHGMISAWGPDAPPDGARRVSFGAGYVFVVDELPYDVRSRKVA